MRFDKNDRKNGFKISGVLNFISFRSADDDEEEYQSQFSNELAMMDTDELDFDVAMGVGPEDLRTSHVKWARPNLPPINPKTDAVVFQQIDIDHYIGQPMAGMPGAQVRTFSATNLV